jgi:streptogramin lyase
LRLEPLEDRLAPAVITVTSNADTIAVDGLATLREAITSINNQADVNGDVTLNRVGNYASLAGGTPDVINFNIPGSGVKTIAVSGTPEPTITRPLTINGYTETGASANTLANADNAVILIRLDGAAAGSGSNALTLGTGSAGSTIRGLDITNFQGNGIVIQSNGNTIAGNFVGVDPAGTTRMPNGSYPNSGAGILIISASNNQIGSTNPADRNVASGNALDGIHVEGTLTSPATGNIIQGNFVGVAADGHSSVGNRTEPAPAPGTPEGNNLFGIEISGGNMNTVGGTAAGARNVVGFNGAGIEVDNGGQQNIIQGNFSGVGADGVTPAGNLLHGIVLRSSGTLGAPLGPGQTNEPPVSNNLIGGTAAGAGNVVEFNGTGGIAIFGNPLPNNPTPQPNNGNAIEGNSVFENGRGYLTASSKPLALLGIDLTNQFIFPRDDGFTPNDMGHPTGTPPGTLPAHGHPSEPNNFQNFPVLTSAFEDGTGKTDITGTLQMLSPSTPAGTTFRIEFFANDPDPLNLPAEGQQFLGFVNATTDASGKATFSASLNVPVASNRIFTATATDPVGNTSEFSNPLPFSTSLFSTDLLQFSGSITANALPTSIVRASDGNFWFTEFGNNALGRITPSGLVTEFSLASLGTNTGPLDLVSDTANGFIYFTMNNTGRIARINPMAGSDMAILASESQSAVVPSGAGAGVGGITVGPDGNLWFTETNVDKIAKINPTLTTVNEFSTGIMAGSAPSNIVTGPDGALWFTETNNGATGAIGRITTAGTVTNEFLLPGTGANNDPEDITVGPDDNLWFTEAGTSRIGRITTAGVISTFALPAGSNPQGITSGPFGHLYFAETGRDLIGSITTSGVITELGRLPSGSQPTDVTAGGNNALWFTEAGNNGNTIGRFFGLSPQERAVQAMYIDALGRAGSMPELDEWASLLPAGAASLTPVVASGIEGSPEARDRLAKGWYTTYLGRSAVGGEEMGWVNLLLAGQSEEQVLSGILGSTEFFNRAQSLIGGSDANSNFVQALYQLLPGRTGSAGEVAGWVNDLQSGARTRQGVAFGFLSSPEYRTDVVAGDYIHLLHRTGSQAEISGWVNSGFDALHIRVGIESSAEHFGLVVSNDYFSGPPADLVTGRPPTFAGVTTINDVFAFVSPSNAANTVLIFNFQPFPGALTPSTADPNLTYDIHVDNSNPLDAIDNLDFQVTYGAPDANGVQSVTLRGLPSGKFPPNGILAQGSTGQNIPIAGGGMFRSGIQDEPGYFDAGAFSRAVAAGDLTQFPQAAGKAKDFYGPNGNTFSIIIEIPSKVLTPTANGIIGVWATISKNGTQISRMGRPLIDAALIPPVPRNNLSQGDLQAAFEAGQPSTDVANFTNAMDSVLTNPKFYFKKTSTTIPSDATILSLLLPDMLVFQIGNTAGYGTVISTAPNHYLGNGRKLTDPVVDTTLGLLIAPGVVENVPDDNGFRVTDGTTEPVSGKNRAIAFPYIGAANLPLDGPGTLPNP